MVDTEVLDEPGEIAKVRGMIERHRELTGSARARQVLDGWDSMVKKFVRIMPKDFKRAVASLERAHQQGLSGDEAIMVAFEENARDLARVGGN
jgi:glutamate synthase (ferredoxin)